MELLLQNKSALLFAAGTGALVFFLMRFWSRRYLHASPAPRSEPLAPRRIREAAPQQPLRDAPAEIARWQVEMHDLARDLKGELDTKIAILQRLVIDARGAAERLEKVLDHAATDSAAREP
jgi:hypothetical protein